jgi:surface polysaccharide O-acyltransferase-like enzyme
MLMLEDVCSDANLLKIIKLIIVLIQVAQIAVPIGIIILGTLDLGKAVIASKEDEIKKAQKSLIRRFIAAAIVFMVVIIVRFVMGQIGSREWETCWDAAGGEIVEPNPQ